MLKGRTRDGHEVLVPSAEVEQSWTANEEWLPGKIVQIRQVGSRGVNESAGAAGDALDRAFERDRVKFCWDPATVS